MQQRDRQPLGESARAPATASPDSAAPEGGHEDLQNADPVIREEGETAGEGVELEASDADSDAGRIDEPFDPTKIRITTKEPSLDIVVARIQRGEIDLQPDFQRAGNIWPRATQSRLIESLLLRIPLPVFYMAADRDDNWQVVDGLQRLSALRNFILKKTLSLRGLEYLSQFEGHSYDALPRPMQRRIKETQISCHVIEPGTPPAVMYNVFKRINTEGKPLVGQEIRHALNPGPGRDLLRELAESAEFKKATDGTVSPKRLADRECVLRFLAFRSVGDGAYAGRLDDYLMNAMKSLNADPKRHPALIADFRRAMLLAGEAFGREAFRKPIRGGFARRRSPVNKPLFESLAVALAEIPEDQTEVLTRRRENLVRGMNELMEDPGFFESISVGTQTTRAVGIRFGGVRDLVQGVLS